MHEENYTSLFHDLEGEMDIEKTKNIDDFIQEDINLKSQYDNLNTYYNFAVKSLNYFIPKIEQNPKFISEVPPDNDSTSFENQVIKKTSAKINDLFSNSV